MLNPAQGSAVLDLYQALSMFVALGDEDTQQAAIAAYDAAEALQVPSATLELMLLRYVPSDMKIPLAV